MRLLICTALCFCLTSYAGRDQDSIYDPDYRTLRDCALLLGGVVGVGILAGGLTLMWFTSPEATTRRTLQSIKTEDLRQGSRHRNFNLGLSALYPAGKVPTDAWGKTILWQPLDDGRLELRSEGADEILGSSDDITLKYQP